MTDLSQFECTCWISAVSSGDKKVAALLGVTEEEAHALMDAIEQCLDEAVSEQWENR